MIQAWMPEEQARRDVRIATSAEADAHAALAAFRLTPEPAVLVTVAMAYEGLAAPEVRIKGFSAFTCTASISSSIEAVALAIIFLSVRLKEIIGHTP